MKQYLTGPISTTIAATFRNIITVCLFILIPISAHGFDSDTFTLEEDQPDIQWLDLPDGWEDSSGLSLGISGEEMVLFIPKQGKNWDIKDKDWPPRIILTFPIDPALPVKEKMDEEYPLEFSELLDKITLAKTDTSWEATIYMNRQLPKRINDGEKFAWVYIRFLGTWFTVAESGEGWRLWEYTKLRADGVQHAFIVQVNPSNPLTGVKIALADQFGRRTLRLDDYSQMTSAIGGINGGYFSSNSPIGLVISNGTIKSPPVLSRPVLALKSDGSPMIGSLPVECRIAIGNGNYFITDTINDYYHGKPVLLTPGHPGRVHGDLKGLKIIIENDVVTGVTDEPIEDLSGKTIIWDPEFSSSQLKKVSPGDAVNIQMYLHDTSIKPLWAVQAGPVIVRKGHVIDDCPDGMFLKDITGGRSPRTAVATTSNGELLLFAGEGRMSIHSMGFSLKEVAEILVQADAVDAINLDGGGSTSMFWNGSYRGDTPTGERKAVSDAIVVGAFGPGSGMF